MNIKCYDFFGCPKKECIMFDEKTKISCWEVEPEQTQCVNLFSKGSIKMKDKIAFCKNCLFCQLANEAPQVESNFKFHNFD